MCDQKLAKLICKFLDDIILVVPQETDLIVLRSFMSSAPPGVILENFMNYVYPLKSKIQGRDESFFLKNDVFGPVAAGQVTHFRQLWKSGVFTEEDKQSIWRWFDAFLVVCDRMNKKNE
jgi:hypothetical protein